MVFVNDKKYACASCIKGHRASQCGHSERPLFEVKKKGRPLSQCPQCRAARHSRNMHSKCDCKNKKDEPMTAAASGHGTRRYIPIIPALPNGLKDAFRGQPNSSDTPNDSRQRVEALLNPCPCKDVWNCKCRDVNAARTSASTCIEHQQPVLAAASIPALPTPARRRCCQKAQPSTTRAHGNQHKHATSTSAPSSIEQQTYRDSPIYRRASPPLDLPPIVSAATPSDRSQFPVFPIMPPMSTIKSLAGTGCTCGVQCRCPGCVEHRTPQYASKDHGDCHDGCRTCVDHAAGIELPTPAGPQSSASSGSSTRSHPSIIDQFFARAAALPQPPRNRKMGVHLDPTNVNVFYPPAISSPSERLAFGFISLPKLKCCSGRCVCSGGRCSCEEQCSGECAGHGHDPGGVAPDLATVTST